METTRKNNNFDNIKNIFVIPCVSNRTGEAVKNQYVIKFNNYIAFQSYDSLIAVYDRDSNNLILGCDFDYSVTTLKYLHQFLYEYCYSIYKDLIKGKSLKDSLIKSIEKGLIGYDDRMR